MENKSTVTRTRDNQAVLDKIIEILKQEFNDESRADFLHSILSKPATEITTILIDEVYKNGFDVNLLAYLAVTTDNKNSFDIAIEKGADFVTYQIKELGNKTLLQYMINQKQDSFYKICLESLPYVQQVQALNIAMCQDDVPVLEKLLSFNGSLVHEKMQGLSLLQFSIACKEIKIMAYLLKSHPNLETVISDQGVSAFEYIIESKNKEVVDTYAK